MLAVLWLLVVGLAALVLALYRAVDRAYRHDSGLGLQGLPRGAELPALEVLTQDGVALLKPRDKTVMWLLVFVSATCDTCKGLLKHLLDRRVEDTPIVLVVTHGEAPTEAVQLSQQWHDVSVEHLLDPADAANHAKVERVPFAYVLRGERILAGAMATSALDLEDLVRSGGQLELDDEYRTEEDAASS